jgi:hypothetical protein
MKEKIQHQAEEKNRPHFDDVQQDMKDLMKPSAAGSNSDCDCGSA